MWNGKGYVRDFLFGYTLKENNLFNGNKYVDAKYFQQNFIQVKLFRIGFNAFKIIVSFICFVIRLLIAFIRG